MLKIEHVSKTFPGVKALDDVSIEIGSHEVVALAGHNGSGKSTLVKILAGVYSPDDGGSITIDGEPMHGHAKDRLHFIHQDLGLIPMLNTIENLDLTRELHLGGLKPVSTRKEVMAAQARLAEFGADFDVRAPLSELSPAERTIVAITRALAGWTRDDNILVLDEPTATLPSDDVATLLRVVRRIADGGAGVIFTSHRLAEVVEAADRVIVLKNGQLVANELRGAFDQAMLVRLIAGAQPAEIPGRTRKGPEGVVLSVQGLQTSQIKQLDLDVRAGEIVGISGVIGSGMEQVAGAVFGAVDRYNGTVAVLDNEIPPMQPRKSIRAGMGLVPADRRRLGGISLMNARENLTLPRLRNLRGRLGTVNPSKERAEARDWMESVSVRPSGMEEQAFGLFSGGNQQKIVLAKWLRLAPKVLILDEPTQGVDVGAQAGIYELISRAAAAGMAVVVASSDAKELAELCDRVLVLAGGLCVAELQGAELTETAIVHSALTENRNQQSETEEGVA